MRLYGELSGGWDKLSNRDILLIRTAILQSIKYLIREVETVTISWIPFRWIEDDIGGRRFEKAGMFVMGELSEVGLSGLFQFDLGAPSSVLYENDVADVLDALRNRINPDRHIVLNGVEYPVVHTRLMVGDQVQIENIGLLEDFGGGKEDITEDGVRVLGTVGADIVDKKCLIIDFPQARLAIMDEAPAAFIERAAFVPLQRSPAGHVLLPVTINGEAKRVLFDTGSSIFELLTDKEQWATITEGKVVDTLDVSVWGSKQTVYGGVVKAAISLGEVPLGIHTAYRNDLDQYVEFDRQHNLMGVMGNAPFWNDVIILDFSQNRFGLVRN